MVDKKLLEEYQLYREFPIQINNDLRYVPKPSIHMHCDNCNSSQTFNMHKHYQSWAEYSNSPIKNETLTAQYTCEGCKEFIRYFLLKINEDATSVMKVGQYPAYDISVDPSIEKSFKEHIENFKKGKICESQSYGIGAFAYYRRIIELVIDELLNSIEELLDGEKKEKYHTALMATKKTKVATEKIELVKDLLPDSLKYGGHNPLGILHDNLSAGIHAGTDKECIENADAISIALVFLMSRISKIREEEKKFSDSMEKLLLKKSKKMDTR